MARQTTGKKLRFEVFERDSFSCRYCGAQPPDAVLVLDHVLPVAADGETTADNLVTACEPCNQGKSSRLLGQFPPPPDADVLYLRTQQEIAELRRYHASVEAKESQVARVIASLQGVWIRTSGADWMPSESLLNQALLKYQPASVDIAIRETAARVGGDFFTERGAWVRYFWAVARNAEAESKPEMSDADKDALQWEESAFFADKAAWLQAFRAALSETPEPAAGADAVAWADREWDAVVRASRALCTAFLDSLPGANP